MNVNMKKIALFARHFGAELIILFGSSVDSRRAPEDIDVALVMSEKKRQKYERDIDAYTNLWLALGKALGVSEDKLDITFVSSKTPPLLLYYIARDGKLLFGRRRDFGLFRIKSMRAFFDYERWRKIYENYIQKFFHAGQKTY